MTTLRFLIILLLVLNALAFSVVRGWLGGELPAGEASRIASQLDPERIRLAGEAAAPPLPVTTATGQGLSATLPMPETTYSPAAAGAEPGSATATATAPGDIASASAQGGTETPLEPAPGDAISAEPAQTSAPAAADEGADLSGTMDATAPAQVADSAPPPEAALPDPVTEVATATVCHAWANLSAEQADRLSQRLRRIGATPIRTRIETPDSWWVRIPPQRSRAEAERRVIELNLLGVTDTFIVQEPGPTQYAVSLGVFKTENRARVLLGLLRTRGVTNAGIEPRTRTVYRIQANVAAGDLRTVESAAPGLRGRREACPER